MTRPAEHALIKQLLDALVAQQEAIVGVPTGPERQVQWAIDAAREYLAAPEQSEPVAWIGMGGTIWRTELVAMRHDKNARPLYTHPAPKAGPPLTFGWLTACDEEMIGAHLGVANLSDSYESAKAKLRTLIDWHVAVTNQPLLEALTDEEIDELIIESLGCNGGYHQFARAALATQREKK